ncbi:MAG: dihydrolipoyllysine-residue acetyltransferase [Gammaproteobacteria bacterium]|nr:dihydrolipoyllysine-residue acetyltransferase [Gammaproteobacteria bacterium]MBQ0775374.1 dihydrolipoyllysine-residue acetyltransferase [Gammaproteobacteria bacterium]
MSVDVIKVPDIGSSDPVDVIEISVKVGDSIAAEDTIVVLESDKATVEVPAPSAGVVARLLVKIGDRIREGDPLLELESGQGEQNASADATAATDPGKSLKKGASSKGEKGEKDVASTARSEAVASKPSNTGSSQEQQVVVPDLGDIESAELLEFSVSVGDALAKEQVIAVLESDKASLEIPAPFAGVVTALTAKIGDKLSSGSALIMVLTEEVEAAAAPSNNTPVNETKTVSPTPSNESAQKSALDNAAQNSGKPAHAGPAVRKLAREVGVTLSEVAPSGPKGRILKDDVHAHVKRLLGAKPASAGSGLSLDLPDIDFSKFGPVERVELNKIRKLTATNLHRSWLTVPHVTQHDEADISDLESFRQQENKRLAKQGAKLTMLAFMVKACASALREFPQFNSSLEKSGEALIQKQYINIGVAVETENGLVVPVVRDADQKGIVDIAIEVGELAVKARNKKLAPKDMQGGTFSISSLGGIGGTAFTPIVNWPEVAILGVSKSQMKPLWDGKAFEPRLMLPLSLSYDHRVIDGADAARFVAYLCSTLTDMRRALL